MAKERKNKFLSVCKRLLLVLAAVALVFVVYQNWDRLSPSNILEWIQESIVSMGKGGGYPVKIAGNTVTSMERMGEDVALVTDSGFLIYNSTGKQLCLRQHSYTKPAMAVTDTRALVYDIGSKNFRIEGRSKTFFTSTAKGNILCGDISVGGNYLLVTDGQGYQSEATVYNKKNEQLYKWYSAENIVFSAALDNGGRHFATSAVNSETGDLLSYVSLFDLSKTDPVGKLTLEGLVLDMAYMGNGHLQIVTNRAMVTVDGTGKILTTQDYSSGYFTDYSLQTNEGLLLATSEHTDRKSSELNFYYASGEKKTTVSIMDSVRSLDFYGTNFGVLTANKVLCYNAAGEKTGEYDVAVDCHKMLMAHNRIYVLGISELRCMEMK